MIGTMMPRVPHQPFLWLFLSAALATSCTGFHEAAPGVLRSPFAREEQLIRRIGDHGVRTVLCLRGGNAARLTERACLVDDVEFVAVPISAKRPPPPAALLRIWQLAEQAERPILMHCRAGVDRTGLAAALFVLHDTGGNFDAARRQLSLWHYGHLAAFGTEAMDDVLDAYEPHAATMSFPEWVEQVYEPHYQDVARG